MSDNEEMELDQILSVLENPIRRRILMKLSRDTNYPLQLSRELNISQQAIMKHLKVLEENSFVTSYEERSDRGGPPRKVYVPRRRYCIRIDIGPNTYSEEFYSFRDYDITKSEEIKGSLSYQKRVVIDGKVTGEMKDDIVAALPAFTDPGLEKMRIDLEGLVNKKNDLLKMKRLKDLIALMNKEIKELEKKRKRILAIRERTFKEVNELVAELSDDYLEKEILSLFIKEEMEDIEGISEKLNLRKVVIEKIIEKYIKGLS